MLTASQPTTKEATVPSITDASLALFLEFVEDAPNWSGCPMAEVTKEERGNLTQLKRAKLLTTFVDEGIPFVLFTKAGLELAAQHGHDLSWIEGWARADV